MKKQIFYNLFSSYLGKGIGILLGIVLVPFLITKLGMNAFGIIALAESLIAFVEVASVSVRTALSREATFALSQNDSKAFVDYLSTGRGVLMASAVIVFMTGAGIAALAPRLFNMPHELSHQSQWMFLLMTFAFTGTIPNNVYWSVLYAKQRFDLINIASSAALILRALFLFLFFTVLPHRYINLTTYGAVYWLVTWAQNHLIYLWHRGVIPGLDVRRGRFERGKVKEIFSFSFYTSINNLSRVIYNSAVQVIINVFLGPAANAVFAVSLKFPSAVTRLFEQAAWTLTPTFTDYAAREEKRPLKRLFFLYTKASSALSAPVCIFLVLFSDEIIRLWVGDKFSGAVVLMLINVVAVMLTLPMLACGCLFNAYAKVKIPCFTSIASTVLLIAGSITLIKWFGFGLLGMTLTDAVLTIGFGLWFSPVYACHAAGLPIREFLSEGFLKPLTWAWAVWGVGLALAKHFWLHEGLLASLPLLVVVSLALGVLYLVGGYFAILDREEREFAAVGMSRLKSLLGAKAVVSE